MKIIKYVGAGVCLLLALAQVMPIYLILSSLFRGQGEDSAAYFIGKLLGHLLVAVLVLFVASKLIKSEKN